MSLIDQLSSRVGDRTQAANVAVAAACAANPPLLAELAEALGGADAALAGDCAEVFTMVAQQHPASVVPYANRLAGLLAHKNTRVRWEATHALALVAPCSEEAIAPVLDRLAQMIECDPSVIVRDYAVDAVGGYTKTGPAGARAAYPLLKRALDVWGGKHAQHALAGLASVALVAPECAAELDEIAHRHLDHPSAIVRKKAQALLRASARAR